MAILFLFNLLAIYFQFPGAIFYYSNAIADVLPCYRINCNILINMGMDGKI